MNTQDVTSCKTYAGYWDKTYTQDTPCGDDYVRRLFIRTSNFSSTPLERTGAFVIDSSRSMNSVSTEYGTIETAQLLFNATPIAIANKQNTLILTNPSSTPVSVTNGISMFRTVLQHAGPVSTPILYGYLLRNEFAANSTGTMDGYYPFALSSSPTSGANVTFTTSAFFSHPFGKGTGVSYTNLRQHACQQSALATGINTCHHSIEMTGGTTNAAYWVESNSATCGAGFVAGTAADTCLYRGRANAWTGPAGTDIYTDSGYICAGTGCSSVTASATGVYDAGVRVMSSVSCTGATCSLTNGALSVTVTGTTSATVSASITGGGSCGGSVSVLGSWSNMRVTLTTGTGPGCSVPGDDVFQVVRGTACGSSGVPVCNISPGDDVSPPLTWNGPSGSGTTRIARTPSYGSTLSVSTTYYYDIRCGCTTD